MHQVAILALDGVVPYDLSIACEVFSRMLTSHGKPAYAVKVCGLTRTVRSYHFEMRVAHGLEAVAGADTVIVPGIEDAFGNRSSTGIQGLVAASGI